ncbi:VOC family protein [Mucilaginibacter jinjuensis]|uniref:VOC family protein n=1 Tax=Mucilaginibacter jinjuensis TaxID=1176721 RepID=A0ABY7TCB1_9SPHI|nr:VOC family protein [Mucilaginibacter jinjuensis]WCT13272.1 VOC family protein [Mucilaginibacter jinjuensis]
MKIEIEQQAGAAEGLASLSLYDVAFTVSDLNKATNWYASVLNFKLVKTSAFDIPTGQATAAIMEGAGIRLELLHIPGGKRIEAMFAPVPLHLIPIGNKAIVFQVEDLKKASEELAAKGIGFVWREHYLTDGGMLCSMIEDVDGNKINIFQRNTTV